MWRGTGCGDVRVCMCVRCVRACVCVRVGGGSPIGIFFFEIFFLDCWDAIPFLLAQRNKQVSTSLRHSVKLVIMPFMGVVVISFLESFVLATAHQHPLVRRFIRNWSAQTRTTVNSADWKRRQQFIVYVITCLYTQIPQVLACCIKIG